MYTKVIVTFYLKSRNEFESFLVKTQDSNWVTFESGQPIRGLVFGGKWLEFISQSEIREVTTTLVIHQQLLEICILLISN